MKTVYLAGKMTGLDHEQMNGWRRIATDMLKSAGFRVLNPVCTDLCDASEPLLVVSSNSHMIDEADLVLMELAAPRHEVSIGTVAELGYCWAKRKPVIAFSNTGEFEDGPSYIDHPWILGTVRHVYPRVHQAVDAIKRGFPSGM